MKNAINKVGYVNPILLDENHIVIAGELRLLAAKELKFTQIPAIILKNLTKEEADVIRILDNRIAEDGEWNYENLKIKIEKLMKFDYSFEELAFETIDYEKIFLNKNSDDNKVHNSDKEDESWLDTNIPPLVNQGDLWRLGDHFVYCGNSLTTGSFEVVMQGEKAQIIITDPPYNCPINGHVCGLGKIKHDEFENASGEMTEPEFAELQAIRQIPMTMKDWIAKLDDFIKMTGSELLDNPGKISKLEAENKALAEYAKYKETIKDELSEVEKHFLASVKQTQKQLEQKNRKYNANM